MSVYAGPRIITPSSGLVLELDAGNIKSYPGSGNTWTDTVSGKKFTLYNSPTFSSNNGGYLNFSPSSSQYADSSTSLSSMQNWTVEAWHYYNGTNTGIDSGGLGACIVTEYYTGTPNVINYSLGNDQPLTGNPTNLQAGFWDGNWEVTNSGYTLTTNQWYQIVGTYDGSTIKLYVNNSLINSTNYSGSPASGGHGIRLMRRWDNADYWGGYLSMIKIYNIAFNTDQIAQNFNAHRGRYGI
jgi:Concanavalin A-like lectin/glucanases superfamily